MSKETNKITLLIYKNLMALKLLFIYFEEKKIKQFTSSCKSITAFFATRTSAVRSGGSTTSCGGAGG